MLLLQPTLLLPVLIGCSLASFISPHYVSSYNGYYPVGPITDPEGSGTGSNDGTGANGGYAISPPPGTIFKVYRITPQGKVLVTNCNVCRLCCTGRNISVEIETIPGNQNPGNSGTPDIPRLPQLPFPQNPNPAGSDYQWSYPIPPPQEGYRTAPYSPNQPQTSTPGTIPSPAGPGSNPPAPDFPSPAPPGPSPTNPIPSNPDTVPTPQFPQYPNYPYYPVAPGQYVTPPPVTNPPCVPVTTTTSTTTTTTQAPTTTTTTPIPPCTYTPPTPTPTVTSPPSSYVTPPTSGYPIAPSSTVPPVDSYLITETTPITVSIGTTTPVPVVPEGNRACCTIDLRSLQAIVSCGISVGAKGSTGQGCCTQSCSPGSIRQRPIQINLQFFSRYFQQLESTRITCEQAISIGLIKSTDIEGFCNQYVPSPTNGPPSGLDTTTVPPVWSTGEPGGNYVIPPTQGSANLSVITSIVTIVIATVLCF